MIFDNTDEMKDAGFQGFCTVESLMANGCAAVPDQPGVYFVLWLQDSAPEFLQQSPAGEFKGRNPSVPVDTLQGKWVQGSKAIYIGSAGGGESDATLQSRIKDCMKAGQGRPVADCGEELIWQIRDCQQLQVCWVTSGKDNPRNLETSLLVLFETTYGRHPFANLTS